jgi:hypothetical protein
VHSRFRRAVNFLHGRHLVFLVDQEIGAGPLNIVLGGTGSQQALARISSLRVEEHFLGLDEHCIHFDCGDCYRSDFTLPDCDANRLALQLGLFRQLLADSSAAHSLAFLIVPERINSSASAVERAFVSRVRRAIDQFFGGSLIKGVCLLKGCGAGLTPSGDDFIAGVLVGLHFVQQHRQLELGPVIGKIFRAATGNNIFSNTFLDLARRGLVCERLKNLILALVGEDSDALRAAALKLFAVGATSGSDLGTGFLMTLLEENGAVRSWQREVASLRSSREIEDESNLANSQCRQG